MAVLGKLICWSFATTLVNWTPLGDHLMVFENKHTWWCSCSQSTHLQATVLSMEPIWKQFQPQKAGTTFAGWNAKVHCHWEQFENNFPSWKPPAALYLTHTNVLPLLFLTHTSVLFIQMGIKPPISTVGWRISRLNQASLKSRASDLTLRRRICSVGACFPSILSADRYIQSGLLLAVCYRDACIYLGSFSERHP